MSSPGPYECETCSKTYRNIKSLKCHVKHCSKQWEMMKEMRAQLDELREIVNMLSCLPVKQQQHKEPKENNREVKETHKKSRINAFGHENYTHLVHPINTCFLIKTLNEEEDLTVCFQKVLQMLYHDPNHKENCTILYQDNCYHLYNGSGWKRTENRPAVLKRVRQRVNNILQHFITTDTEEFLRNIEREDMLKLLDSYTYKIDTSDENPEFEEELNKIVEMELSKHKVECD